MHGAGSLRSMHPPISLPAGSLLACLTCENLAFSLQALPVCRIVAKFSPGISRMLGDMMIEMIQSADLSILHAIQGAASPALDAFMVGFTTLGEFGALWAIVGAIMIALNKHRTFGIAIFVAIALAFVIGDIGLKNVIERPRPFLVDPVLMTSLISLPGSFSCPSGHSSTSFAAATVICLAPLAHRWLKPTAMATAAAIAFSRLYLAVHNPTDVVLGALLGIACGCIAVCIVNTIESRRKGRQA